MGEDNPATIQTRTEKEEEKLDPLKSIKDQIVAYDPEDKEADGGNPLTKEQESEALPTLKSGQKYTCFTCQSQDSYKWFKSKMEENVGKVICKRCYHKELVELSDKICAVRSCVESPSFLIFSQVVVTRTNEKFLLLLTFFTNALILSQTTTGVRHLENIRMLVPIEEGRFEVFVPKVLQERGEIDGG